MRKLRSHRYVTVPLIYLSLFVGLVLLFLLLGIVFYKKMPTTKEKSTVSFGKTVKSLIKRKHYSMGVVAQFFYVGAQIGVWSYTIRYVMLALGFVDPVTDTILPEKVTAFLQNYPFWSSLWQLDAASTAENVGNTFYLTSLILFTLSRFVFTALMRYMRPGLLLSVAATGALLSAITAIFAGGMTGVVGLVLISFFMSLMFPTIYGIALEGLTENESKVGGSFLVIVLTAGQGLLSTVFGDIRVSFWIPVVCFVVVALYGIMANKDEKKSVYTYTDFIEK